MNKSHNVQISGPLAVHINGVWQDLLEKGYSPDSSRNLLRVMACLSRWMCKKGLARLTYGHVDSFLAARRRAGYTAFFRRESIEAFLDYLKETGALPPQVAVIRKATATERLLEQYAQYLRDERAVTEATIHNYRTNAQRLICSIFGGKKPQLDEIKAGDLTAFLLHDFRRYSRARAKHTVSSLRSFVRYLFIRGRISHDISGAIPAVAGWRLANLPRGIDQKRLRLLFRACDRRTPAGRRDYALMLLLLRLGLRVCEAKTLTLDDIDWSKGELIIRGKGGREDRLPLPKDVGSALVCYIRYSRPQINCRSIFLRVHAPYGPISRSGLIAVVQYRAERAGLSAVSAHRLRHTVATQMLRKGGSLDEIAQVLRHKSHNTTAIYAKVDVNALKEVSRPWPIVNVIGITALREVSQPWLGGAKCPA